MLPEPAVAATLARYLALIDAQADDLLLGLYLVGSVALGDFREGRSDIDFVALLRRDLGAADVDTLRRIHDDLRAEPPSFDGIYIDPGILAALPMTPSVVPFSLDGAFDVRPTFETNPAVWLCLTRRGIRVLGPEITSLTIAQDERHLRSFLVGNLQTYWTDWIANSRTALASKPIGQAVSAEAYAWGVLGTARIACTLATGRIVSKSEAGRWALSAWPAAWHDVIADALAVRQDGAPGISIERFRRALAFMDTLIAQTTAR